MSEGGDMAKLETAGFDVEATLEGPDHLVYASKPFTDSDQWKELCRQVIEFVRAVSPGQADDLEVEVVSLHYPEFDHAVLDRHTPVRYKPFRFEQMVVKFK
jgi:hypothetical protein